MATNESPTPGSRDSAPSVDQELLETLRTFGRGRRVFSRFVLQRELGKGGMGVVWLANDERLGMEIALKFLPGLVASDPEALHDLRREITKGLRLTHQGIVRMYDLHEDANVGLAAIAMEYVDGPTLGKEKLKQPGRCFDVAQPLVSWVRELCEVLSYVHEKAKVVHRDLKPGNIMLTEAGELKVADFGIAATLSDSHSRLTQHPGSSGTPAYMSPQQAMGRNPSAADDVYALGATLYELLTSKPPFFRGNMSVILNQVAAEVPPLMGQRRHELEINGKTAIPQVWEETIAACLAKDPGERPVSVRAVAALLDLMEGARSPVPAASVSQPAAPPILRVQAERSPQEAAEDNHRPSLSLPTVLASQPAPISPSPIRPVPLLPKTGSWRDEDGASSATAPPSPPSAQPFGWRWLIVPAIVIPCVVLAVNGWTHKPGQDASNPYASGRRINERSSEGPEFSTSASHTAATPATEPPVLPSPATPEPPTHEPAAPAAPIPATAAAPDPATAAGAVAVAVELPKVKADLDAQRDRTAVTGGGTNEPPAGPQSVDLTEGKYFDLKALFSGTEYARSNSQSQTEILERAQNIMRQQGLYSGTADGRPGQSTQIALNDWQRKNLLRVTGRLDEETLKAMKLVNLPQENQLPRPTPVRNKPQASSSKRRTEPTADSRPKKTQSQPPSRPAGSRELSAEEYIRKARALEN